MTKSAQAIVFRIISIIATIATLLSGSMTSVSFARSLQTGPAQPAMQAGQGNCESGFTAKLNGPGPVTYTAPAGQIIYKAIVKAGSQNQGQACFSFTSNSSNGCYTAVGIGTPTATLSGGGTSNTCKDISHVEFFTRAAVTPPTATPTSVPPTATTPPTATPTEVVPTATNTPTATPTDVPPTATSTPTATPTDVIPTGTSTPTATPTDVPPTATNTPTATPTDVIPTGTSTPTEEPTTPPTATPTDVIPTGTATPTEEPTTPPTATPTDVIPTGTTLPTATPTDVIPTATSTPTAAPTCPTGKEAISNYRYIITRGGSTLQFNDITGRVQPGDHVRVIFTIAQGCSNIEVSLASYQAQQGTYDPQKEQTLYDSDTGFFGPGEHSLEVDVPLCFFQVDFVYGSVLSRIGPPNSYYGSRRIDDAVGGTTSCSATPTETATPPTETATPPTATPTTTLPTGSGDVMVDFGYECVSELNRADAAIKLTVTGQPVTLNALSAVLEGANGGETSFTPANLVGQTLAPGSYDLAVRFTNFTLTSNELTVVVSASFSSNDASVSDSFSLESCTATPPTATPPAATPTAVTPPAATPTATTTPPNNQPEQPGNPQQPAPQQPGNPQQPAPQQPAPQQPAPQQPAPQQPAPQQPAPEAPVSNGGSQPEAPQQPAAGAAQPDAPQQSVVGGEQAEAPEQTTRRQAVAGASDEAAERPVAVLPDTGMADPAFWLMLTLALLMLSIGSGMRAAQLRRS